MNRHAAPTEVLTPAIVPDAMVVFERRGCDPDRSKSWSDRRPADQTTVAEPLA